MGNLLLDLGHTAKSSKLYMFTRRRWISSHSGQGDQASPVTQAPKHCQYAGGHGGEERLLYGFRIPFARLDWLVKPSYVQVGSCTQEASCKAAFRGARLSPSTWCSPSRYQSREYTRQQ